MTAIYIPGLAAGRPLSEEEIQLREGPGASRNFSLDELNDEPRMPYTGSMKYLHSVSELKMVPPSKKGCPRKWALMYLAKVPKVPNEALIDGILLHRCIQDWFKYCRGPAANLELWVTKWMPGTLSQTGKELRWYARLAQAILRHVTERERLALVSEPTFFLEIPELDTAIYIKPDGLLTQKFEDWKTTAATTKTSPWVLQQPDWHDGRVPETHQTITHDIQSRTYAHGLMKQFEWPTIDANWVYGSKKFTATSNVKTWICATRFERDETRQWVETNVWPMIRWMNAVKDAFATGRLDSAMLVPHSSRACEGHGKFCDAYGTCKMYKSPIPLHAVNLPIIPN